MAVDRRRGGDDLQLLTRGHVEVCEPPRRLLVRTASPGEPDGVIEATLTAPQPAYAELATDLAQLGVRAAQT